jgi:hypothetical protein
VFRLMLKPTDAQQAAQRAQAATAQLAALP